MFVKPLQMPLQAQVQDRCIAGVLLIRKNWWLLNNLPKWEQRPWLQQLHKKNPNHQCAHPISNPTTEQWTKKNCEVISSFKPRWKKRKFFFLYINMTYIYIHQIPLSYSSAQSAPTNKTQRETGTKSNTLERQSKRETTTEKVKYCVTRVQNIHSNTPSSAHPASSKPLNSSAVLPPLKVNPTQTPRPNLVSSFSFTASTARAFSKTSPYFFISSGFPKSSKYPALCNPIPKKERRTD